MLNNLPKKDLSIGAISRDPRRSVCPIYAETHAYFISASADPFPPQRYSSLNLSQPSQELTVLLKPQTAGVSNEKRKVG